MRQAAAGVNYIDVYIARGEYRLVEPPAPLGMEAAGTVIDVGPEVHDILPGDRVAYALASRAPLPPPDHAGRSGRSGSVRHR